MQRFITIDDQILMACTGDEIKIVRMAGSYIHNIVQVHNHMIQSQNRSGRLALRITDEHLNLIAQHYMTGVGVVCDPYFPYWNKICTVPPTIPFELAIVEGDPTDRATWKTQIKWDSCFIAEDDFKPRLKLNDDELIIHTLPIDFADMQYSKKDDRCSSLLSDAPQGSTNDLE